MRVPLSVNVYPGSLYALADPYAVGVASGRFGSLEGLGFGFVDVGGSLLSAATSALADIGRWIVRGLTEFLPSLLAEAWEGLKSLGGQLLGFVTDALGAIWDATKAAATWVYDGVLKVGSWIAANFKTVVDNAAKLVKAGLDGYVAVRSFKDAKDKVAANNAKLREELARRQAAGESVPSTGVTVVPPAGVDAAAPPSDLASEFAEILGGSSAPLYVGGALLTAAAAAAWWRRR